METTFNTIRTTIETELGVAAGSIPNDANLADLGMDSLMSLLVLGNLAGTLPIELPASLFMDCTSLREIRAFLALSSASPPAVLSPSPKPSTSHSSASPSHQRRSLSSSARARIRTAPHRYSSSLTAPACPPSTSTSRHRSAHLLAQLALPILRLVLTGGITPIAQHYLASMRLVQPTGPYLVGGWSFGGMAAFEIARLLSTFTGPASERVAGLFLLDSPCPLTHPPLPMSITDWILTAPEVKDIAPPALSDRLVAHFQGDGGESGWLAAGEGGGGEGTEDVVCGCGPCAAGESRGC